MLRYDKKSEFSIFQITALAGTGKAGIFCFLLHCFMPELSDTQDVAVVLVPGKDLRDEVLTNLDILGRYFKNNLVNKVL